MATFWATFGKIGQPLFQHLIIPAGSYKLYTVSLRKLINIFHCKKFAFVTILTQHIFPFQRFKIAPTEMQCNNGNRNSR